MVIYAILENKRQNPFHRFIKDLEPDFKVSYIVDVQCPKCQCRFTVNFGGWSSLVCQKCKIELKRPKQKRKQKPASSEEIESHWSGVWY